MNYSSENSQKFSRETDAVVRTLISRGLSISVMESCTGGFFSSGITDTEGASAVFPGGFVTYSNEAKIRNGVPAEVIERYGVYSPETAQAMAQACRAFYDTDIGVGITGCTGNPDPENADGVPGEVFYAVLCKEQKILRRTEPETEGRTRHEIKMNIVREVVRELAEMLDCKY